MRQGLGALPSDPGELYDSDVDRRLRSLESWRVDVGRELREWERWVEVVQPFIEQLQADLTYRQRRHAEQVSEWSTFAKVLAAIVGVVVALCAIGTFTIELVRAVT